MSTSLSFQAPLTRTRNAARKQVIVAAQNNGPANRREMLGAAVLLGVLMKNRTATAITDYTIPIVVDERRVEDPTGYKHIQEGFDQDLHILERRGLAQARADVEGTKQRVMDARNRIDTVLLDKINNKKWSDADFELRGAMGNLRFDMDTLVKNMPTKKEMVAVDTVKDQFLSNMEALDLALRQQKLDKALNLHSDVKSELDNFLTSVGVVVG